NRDHRKITVIDGKTAFTGGINLADEYINEKERYGYWLDSAALVKGEAVNSFTVIFLELWNGSNRCKEDFSPYLRETPKGTYTDGYIIPYADAPTDDENVCEHVYMQIINNAKNYIYVETPYFIVDDSMLSAFILAAKSGVDVRIMTPGIPDKKLVHMTTRSYYEALIKAGVRVYEYTPGFVHSKIMVSDDDTATVGTANFDFRSLYLHYECGELIFNSSAIEDIKQDFLRTLPLCREITEKDTKRNIFVRLGQSILRIIAPLL
ncbi:MAG: cardiolipin synthase, partial [Clostridia bacterium]|nr:cardiolipin synthase [Clostridia bacterium]